MMTFHQYGDNALLINFEQKIDTKVNEYVIQFSELIQKAKIPGIRFLTPAYCSLTVGFDSNIISHQNLRIQIQSRIQVNLNQRESNKIRKLNIPVCYSRTYFLDLQSLKDQTNLSEKEIIHLHTSTLFRVFMIGFLPGFAYMGKLPQPLFCQRKAIPRIKIPAQSVGLAGFQTGIYPSEAPGGWQIIGKTPIPIFDTRKENQFLFKAGDLVQFNSISENSFQNIEKDIRTGHFKISEFYE